MHAGFDVDPHETLMLAVLRAWETPLPSDKALEVFGMMGKAGVQPDTITFSALISACHPSTIASAPTATVAGRTHALVS